MGAKKGGGGDGKELCRLHTGVCAYRVRGGGCVDDDEVRAAIKVQSIELVGYYYFILAVIEGKKIWRHPHPREGSMLLLV
jgi:hypothetical protein